MRSTLLTFLASSLTLTGVATAAAIDKTANSGALVERQFGTSRCATGVHIIVARASGELPGEGIIGSVATQVERRIPGSDSEAVSYPATLYSYTTSQRAGTRAMTQAVQSYAQRCPNTKLVLMGYSQGAHVTGDTLCGSGGSIFGRDEQVEADELEVETLTRRQLASSYTDNIVAVIQMGDPSFVGRKSYDVGTCTRNGIFPRSRSSQTCLEGLASKIQSYCDAGDSYAQAGGLSLATHLSYVTKYGRRAADFVVQQFEASK